MLLSFGSCVFLLMAFVPQLKTHAEYEKRLEGIRAESSEMERRLQDYRVRRERFQNDPNYVRRVAHEIGMVEPHELLFRFQDDTRSATRSLIRR